MNISGRVQNGVIVLEGKISLPEGAVVRVNYDATSQADALIGGRRLELPIVRCDRPGSIHLTNEKIAAILDDEDAAPRH